MSQNNVEIGQRIKAIRIQLGLTMEEFGKKFTPVAAKGAVSNWEKGNYLPNNERLKKIAELGNIPIQNLLYGTTQEKLLKMNMMLHDKNVDDFNSEELNQFLTLQNESLKISRSINEVSRINEFINEYPHNNFKENTIELLHSSLLFAFLNESNDNEDDPKKVRFLNYIINHLNMNIREETNFTNDELINDLSEKLRYIIEN